MCQKSDYDDVLCASSLQKEVFLSNCFQSQDSILFYRQLVIGYWLLVIGYWLLVTVNW